MTITGASRDQQQQLTNACLEVISVSVFMAGSHAVTLEPAKCITPKAMKLEGPSHLAYLGRENCSLIYQDMTIWRVVNLQENQTRPWLAPSFEKVLCRSTSAGFLHIFYDAMFCFGLWRELMMLTSSMSWVSLSVWDRHGPPCALALEANATRQVLSEMSAVKTSLARLRRE